MWFQDTPLMHHYCTGQRFAHGINQVNEFMLWAQDPQAKTH